MNIYLYIGTNHLPLLLIDLDLKGFMAEQNLKNNTAGTSEGE